MNLKHIADTAYRYLEEFIEEESETILEAKDEGEKLTAYCFFRKNQWGENEWECTFDPDWYDEEDGWELWARERVA